MTATAAPLVSRMSRAGDRVSLAIKGRLEARPLLKEATGEGIQTGIATAADRPAFRDAPICLDGELHDHASDMPAAAIVRMHGAPTKPLRRGTDCAGAWSCGLGSANLR